MIKLTLIGIGTGSPDHVTRQASAAMNDADLILIPLKGAEKSDLAGLRREICTRELSAETPPKIVEFQLPVRDEKTPDYRQRVDDWHDAISVEWENHIRAHVGENGNVALLVWGDPSLYDSTLRIAERVGRRLPVETRVIPGITALQVLCAAHAIPLNEIGAPVVITTGRQLDNAGWPDTADVVAVMLDSGSVYRPETGAENIDVWWGAYLGMQEQMLLSGPLSELADKIEATRKAARQSHGWIMDTYLMKRRK